MNFIIENVRSEETAQFYSTPVHRLLEEALVEVSFYFESRNCFFFVEGGGGGTPDAC